ncbi:hypothetical protein PLCT2_02638 [Planctomycetaceae bacterium]|nr:hypothetical protein PLCT2_02638 [Planctomycetaceae bacterium]
MSLRARSYKTLRTLIIAHSGDAEWRGYVALMAVQYHKLLDRILVRRAAERESLERQVGENRPTPRIMMGLFCVGLAGMFALFFLPLALLVSLGALIAFYEAFRVWRQAAQADKALAVETREEEYRRYLLGKLGAQKFDQLAGAVAAGGSEQSIQGWLKPLGFDAQDIEYLLWLAESIVAQVKDGIEQVGGYAAKRPPIKTPPAEPTKPIELAEGAAYVSKPPIEPLQAGQPEPQAPDPTRAPDAAGEGARATSNLNPDEIEKFRRLAAQRKAEYEQWAAQGGGRQGSPDDPLGKLEKYTPAQLEELKRKAQERRKKGEAPQSQAPAPAATDHPEQFSEQELRELEAKALRRFEPRPKVAEKSKEEVLGEVFSEEDIKALAAKAERQEHEKRERRENRNALPPATDHDPEFGEEGS